jgi:hypothetical protein
MLRVVQQPSVRRFRRIVLLSMLIVAGVAVSHVRGRGQRPAPPRTTPLPSTRSAYGLTGRTLLHCPAGDCVLLHYPRHRVIEDDLSTLLVGDPSTTTDDGEELAPGTDAWCDPNSYSTFNCCTYAVGDVVGLRRTDWVAPGADSDTGRLVPMEVLLNSFYTLRQAVPVPQQRWAEPEWRESLQDNDVICLINRRRDSRSIIHTGRVSTQGGRTWMLSKLGRGIIVRASCMATVRHYVDMMDPDELAELQLEVYRPKRRSQFAFGG